MEKIPEGLDQAPASSSRKHAMLDGLKGWTGIALAGVFLLENAGTLPAQDPPGTEKVPPAKEKTHSLVPVARAYKQAYLESDAATKPSWNVVTFEAALRKAGPTGARDLLVFIGTESPRFGAEVAFLLHCEKLLTDMARDDRATCEFLVSQLGTAKKQFDLRERLPHILAHAGAGALPPVLKAYGDVATADKTRCVALEDTIASMAIAKDIPLSSVIDGLLENAEKAPDRVTLAGYALICNNDGAPLLEKKILVLPSGLIPPLLQGVERAVREAGKEFISDNAKDGPRIQAFEKMCASALASRPEHKEQILALQKLFRDNLPESWRKTLKLIEPKLPGKTVPSK